MVNQTDYEDDEFDEEEDGEYAPEFTPLWEKLLGPGAIAATLIAIILALLAMWITYDKIKPVTISYKAREKPEEEEKPEEPELDIEETPVEIPVEDVAEIIVKDVEVSDHNETADNEDFAEAKGDPDNASQVDFDNQSVLDTLGGGGGGGGRKGDRRGGRMNLVKGYGGSRRTESAVMEALRWLRRHQDNNGKWSLENYTANCGKEGKKGRCAGTGDHAFDTGGSALSMLAYTGRGLDHKIAGEFKNTIAKGMSYLKSIQTSEGSFGKAPDSEGFLYNQSIATFALADLLVMSDDASSLKSPVEKGINYLLDAQNDSEGGGWRYNNYSKYPNAKSRDISLAINDTSVTTWVVMALKTAKSCGITVDPKGYAGASKWLDSCYVEESTGKYEKVGTFGYAMNSSGTQIKVNEKLFAATACGVLSRQFMKEKKGVIPGCNTLKTSLPDWDGTRDMYYWYYGSLAMFQLGGDYWTTWNEAMKPALTQNINNSRSLCLMGSWDPEETIWGADYGGRVYSTAIGALTLEVYYRYSVME